MTRIVVEEGGERRAFRMVEGRVSLGSGEQAKVRLRSGDVAAVHADLELVGGLLTLVPRPGVLPPKVDGLLVKGAVALAPGARIEIGSARLVVEPESEAAGAAGPRAREAAVPVAGAARASSPPAAAGGAARGASPRPVDPRAARSRARRSSVPSWLVGAGILLAVVVALLASRGLWSQGASSADPTFPLAKARDALLSGHVQVAEDELDRLRPEQLVGDVRTQAEALRAQIRQRREQEAQRRRMEEADAYLATQLERYEREHLQGKPDSARILVFLERAQHFENTWPTHPRIDWVRRQVGRLRGAADVHRRRTFEELAWKVRMLTVSFPIDYGEVFRTLDAWGADAVGEEAAQLAALRAEQEAARDAYWEDRRQQAMWHWDRDEKGKAVEWLVQLVTKIGDPEREREAAQMLVGLPGIDGWLRGFAQDQPERFARLLRQPVVAEYCRERGIS